MLILTRKAGEAIVVTVGDETVRISVERFINGDKVRIGIETNRKNYIVREELLDRQEPIADGFLPVDPNEEE